MARNFKVGNPGGPGRPKVLLPEVQKAIDLNKNALKILILDEMNALEQGVPKVRLIIRGILERAANDGDATKFKTLLELVFGRTPDDPSYFEVTPEEKELILRFRKRVEEHNGSGPIIGEDLPGDP